MNILGVIPARYSSSRLPGKALADIGGQPMIERVYRQVIRASSLKEVIVATDHLEIEKVVKSFGGRVMMTSTDHQSGTERCREVLDQLNEPFDFLINIQGDEPFIQPDQIDLLASGLNQETELATLIREFGEADAIEDPSVVKAVIDKGGLALYFSRYPIPFHRNQENPAPSYYKHLGIYAYRQDVLKSITELSPSMLEISESLEQLRWLENGYRIKTVITSQESLGVDTPEDLERARRKFQSDS